MTRLERVVQIDHDGRRFTFRVDHDPPLSFWRVETEHGSVRLPVRVLGDEQPGFFLSLAKIAVEDHDL